MRWLPSPAIAATAALSLVTVSSCADEGDKYIFIMGNPAAGGSAGAGGATDSGGDAGAQTSAGRGGRSSGGSTGKGGASGSASVGGVSGTGSGGTSTSGGSASGGTSSSGGTGSGCSGTAVPCGDIEDVPASCHFPGCEDAFSCLGTMNACSTYTEMYACENHDCDWNSQLELCSGVPYLTCEDLGTRLDCNGWPGCRWYECLGDALPCQGLDADSCEINPGCYWL